MHHVRKWMFLVEDKVKVLWAVIHYYYEVITQEKKKCGSHTTALPRQGTKTWV